MTPLHTSSPEEKGSGYRLSSVQSPHLKSYTYESTVPAVLLETDSGGGREPCVLGVDEAGRGPCLGPMVYAVSYCSLARHQELREMGFNDSKQLTEKTRTALAKTVEANADWIGWAVRALSPQDISTNMLARPPFNLNEMAHQATVQLIAGVLKQGVNVTEIYVDPVGPSAPYQAKLSNLFPGIYIKVEPKADAIYPIVGAASVCAKVTRDQVLQDWQWTEQDLKRISSSFGSGYPSDPNTVRWLNENEDAFFAYPTIARFSWKTISDRPKGLHALEWSEDEDDKDTKSTGVKRKASDFITKKPPAKPYYERTSLCSLLCLRSVSEL